MAREGEDALLVLMMRACSCVAWDLDLIADGFDNRVLRRF